MKKAVSLLLLFMLCFAITSSASAFGVASGDSYLLGRGETHHGDLAVAADKAVIEGTIDGDLYVFSENVQVLGHVTGDLISFSANTTILGKVDGNIRSFTQRLTLSGNVGKSVTSSSQHVLITEGGKVGGSMLLLASNVDIFGKVGKETNGLIREIRVTGEIGEGISMLKTEHLQLDSTAVIGGDLAYSSPQKADIGTGARIVGKELYTPHRPDSEDNFHVFPLFLLGMSLLSTLLLWLAIRFLFPVGLLRINQQLDNAIGTKMGIGALILLGAPILSIILLFTVVGIPAAIVLLLSVGLLLFPAKIFVGSWLGNRVVQRLGWKIHPLIADLVGVLLLLILTSIPFLGLLFALPIWMTFLGAVVAAIRQTNRTFHS